MSGGLTVLCLLLLHTGAQGFGLVPGKSLTHQDITEKAIFNATVQVCRALAEAEGKDFTLPAQPFTAEGVAIACGARRSTKSFCKSTITMVLRNVRVDIRHVFNGEYHFDEEMFVQGRKIITDGIRAVKASIKRENFEAARQKLGQIFHPLQDFYSHSNWVEMGNKLPNPNLIRSDTSIGKIADKSRATCRNCDGDDCTNNILEDILKERILISGYTSMLPIFASKPKGKCSHGGAIDRTSSIEPKGGINKDSLDASHGHLHTKAANMAIAATSELLQDIRQAVGDKPFLQMMGISKRSSRGLSFVINTRKSMSDDIETVRSITPLIINSEVGTENEPSLFILVPFNDPGFGQMIKTTDPTAFKNAINSLSATGGGDVEELSLSGLQLALTAAPSSSEIFLFTDAPAKDKHLKSTVIALIERTQTVVNFMITGSTALNRRRRRNDSKITASDMQLYRDLAHASGGQAIEVTKSELPVATSIITESFNSSLVTLLQAARSPGKADNFTFMVDETVTKLTVYITGRSLSFTLISPTGESQQSSDTAGSLITASQSVGNFQSLQLKTEAGLWKMKMVSTNAYALKVIGQSPIDFVFDFVEVSQGLFEGFDVLDTRPQAGVNGSLLVTLTGSDSATVTEVTLVESSGSGEVKGFVEPQASRNFLVHVDRIPSVEFVVQVKGQDGGVSSKASSFVFQRQSPINFRASNLIISAESNDILEPGKPFYVPFSVMTNGIGGNVTIRVTNDRHFNSTFPSSLFLETGKSVNGTVTLTAPLNTPSGTDFTLTIEAEAPRGDDTNYVVLRFSVVNMMTDFTQPVCQLLSLKSNCSNNCSSSMWEISVRVTDGAEGTGVDHVSLKQGRGSLNTNLTADNRNVTLVSYKASCCSPDVELLVVDQVGNVGSCSYTPRGGSMAAISGSIKLSYSTLLYLSMVVLGLHVLTELGIQ